jgi:hypothetical protein
VARTQGAAIDARWWPPLFGIIFFIRAAKKKGPGGWRNLAQSNRVLAFRGRGLDDVGLAFPSPHLKKTNDCKIFVPM